MPFGIIGRTGPGMRQVVGFGDQSTLMGTFGGEFGARHCNQWGLYDVCVRQRRDAALFPNYFGQTCYKLVMGEKRTTLCTIVSLSSGSCFRVVVCRVLLCWYNHYTVLVKLACMLTVCNVVGAVAVDSQSV